MKHLVRIAVAAVAMWFAANLCATGYYGPMVYLDDGGKNVDASPEFYWELEVKRLAAQFRPTEKRVAPPAPQTQADEEGQNFRVQFTANVDLRDYADGLKENRIKPPDAAKATQQHEAARTVIQQTSNTTTNALPEEFDSEFADYHRGAFAYQRGQEHWDEARQAWQNLLKRPEQDRHYRTVWAAFMLGKIA